MLGMMLMTALAVAAPEEAPMYDLVKTNKVATLSSDFEGTPFGSLIVYAVDEDGVPFLFVSDLARHTKNIKKNPKCSLMVMKVDTDDLANSARITFVGKLAKVTDEDDIKKLKKVYLKAHPNSETYIDFDDFNFYRMEVSKIQYIGGFGDINWLEPKKYSSGYRTKD